MLTIWSLVPLPFLKPAWTSGSPQKPGLEDFEHYFASMWDECNCVIVWAFFGIAFLWNWNENWPFPVLWPLLSFPNLLAYNWYYQIFWSNPTDFNFYPVFDRQSACFPSKFVCWNLIPKERYLKVGSLGDDVLMTVEASWMSFAPLCETSERSLAPFTTWKHREKVPSMN